jgi:TorA maturation chaperone TorD
VTLVGDRELAGFRRRYYDLLVSLLWREPAAALLEALATDAAARGRAARRVEPRLAEGWTEIGAFLADAGADAAEVVGDEYVRLFIGPVGPEVNLYESWYLTGRVFDRPLAEVRRFLEHAGIEKDAGYTEPEDFIAFELEVMRTLLGRQERAGDDERSAVDLQNAFMKRHALVWMPEAARDLGAAKGARFYRGVALLLAGFLQTELDLFREWSDDEVLDLAEARERHGRKPLWRGPLADFQPSVPTEPDEDDGVTQGS